MSIVDTLRGFEARHPVIQHLLSTVSVDHLTEADRVAAKFEDIARHLTAVLPDGTMLEDVLNLVSVAGHNALAALATLEGGTLDQAAAPPPAAVPPAAGTVNLARWQPASPAAGPALVPGRDHPITEAPPAAPNEPQGTPSAAAEDVPAEAPPAPDSNTPGTGAAGAESSDASEAAADTATAPV